MGAGCAWTVCANSMVYTAHLPSFWGQVLGMYQAEGTYVTSPR